MQIRVLYFAFFRERIGVESQDLQLAPSANVSDVIAALSQEHTCIASMDGRFRVAVNQDFVPSETVLHEGDELVLIPPVAGGSDDPPLRPVRHVKLTSAPLQLDRVIAAVDDKRAGGIVTFVGQVRDHNMGHAVVRLEYEAYEDMAVTVMTRLCAEIEEEISGVHIAVEHRTGVLAIGDAAVMIAAAAPHRAEAFQACQLLIDRLKEQVPIWKKEVGPDGEEWLGTGP